MPKIFITPEELKLRYENTPTRVLAKELGVTVVTLLRYTKKYGIPLKKAGRPFKLTTTIKLTRDMLGKILQHNTIIGIMDKLSLTRQQVIDLLQDDIIPETIILLD